MVRERMRRSQLDGTKARFEAAITALDISKQEAMSEMLWEMLNRIDDQMERIGIGKIRYEKRLRELGYELCEANEKGQGSLRRIEPTIAEEASDLNQ